MVWLKVSPAGRLAEQTHLLTGEVHNGSTVKELQLAEDGLPGLVVTNYDMQSLFHNSVTQTFELYKPSAESADLKLLSMHPVQN